MPDMGFRDRLTAQYSKTMSLEAAHNLAAQMTPKHIRELIESYKGILRSKYSEESQKNEARANIPIYEEILALAGAELAS
jgi:hypothetical protein